MKRWSWTKLALWVYCHNHFISIRVHARQSAPFDCDIDIFRLTRCDSQESLNGVLDRTCVDRLWISKYVHQKRTSVPSRKSTYCTLYFFDSFVNIFLIGRFYFFFEADLDISTGYQIIQKLKILSKIQKSL